MERILALVPHSYVDMLLDSHFVSEVLVCRHDVDARALLGHDFDVLLRVDDECRSLSIKDLELAFRRLEESGADSIVTARREENVLSVDDEGFVSECSSGFVSVPGFSLVRRSWIETAGLVAGGRTAVYEVGSEKSGTLKGIKVFLTDCDGCLTDGGMYYSEKGDELKKFNTKDGMAFSLLRKAGFKIGVVTGEKADLNRRRFAKLKVDFYCPDCRDKLSAVSDICSQLGLSLDNVLYIGDDLNDLELLKTVGYSCCPANAQPEVKAVVDYIATRKGGDGVIREVADLLLKTGR